MLLLILAIGFWSHLDEGPKGRDYPISEEEYIHSMLEKEREQEKKKEEKDAKSAQGSSGADVKDS